MAHTSLASLFSDIADAIRAKTGGSSQITADDFPTAIAAIPSGGGSSMNVQCNQSTSRTSATSLTLVNSFTCSTAGTYDVYWSCMRSSTGGTWSSRLYVGDTATGDEQTTWSNHVQNVHLTKITIAKNQTVAVYVKTRGSNYYGYAPQITIAQTS